MSLSARGGWSVVAVSLALAGLLATMAAPSPARAGCDGHDLTWSSDLRGTMALLDAPPPEASGPTRWPVPPPRCSGPSCSGTPAPPAGSGAIRTAPPAERWAAAAPPLVRPAEGVAPLVRPEPVAHTRLVPQAPFRPPRPAGRA